MKLLSVRLKNFIGIRNGLGLDEITLDLSKLSGLVALVGTIGNGKTTLLDNLHPHRIMPSKVKDGKYSPNAFKYYDEVYGNAEREQMIEMEGVVYRTILHIDSDQRNQKAYLFRKNGEDWDSLNKSGSTAVYDEIVENIFGSPRLFFNSIFRCQEAPRLNTYKKGLIKDILAELLMLSSIKEKGKAASAVVKALSQLVDRLKAQELLLVPQAGKVDQLAADLIIAEKTHAAAEEDLTKALAAETAAADLVTSINTELVQYQAQEQARDQNAKRADALQKQLNTLCDKQGELCDRQYSRNKVVRDQNAKRTDALQKQLNTLCDKQGELCDRQYSRYVIARDKRTRIGKILSNAAGIRGKQAEEAKLTDRMAAVESELKVVIARIEEAAKFGREAAAVNTEISPLQVKQGQSRTAHQAKISALKSEIARIEKTVKALDGLTCNEDSQRVCPAVKSALEDKPRLGPAREELAALEVKTGEDAAIAAKISELTGKAAELQKKADSRADSARKNELVAEQESINKQLIDVRKWTRLLPELDTAETSIREIGEELATGLAEHIKDLEANFSEFDAVAAKLGTRESDDDLAAGLAEHIKDLEANFSESDAVAVELGAVHAALADLDIVLLSASEAEGRKNEAVKALDAAKKSVEACRNTKTTATVSVASLKESYLNASQAKEQLAAIRDKIDLANTEMVYWSTQEKAFGPDGVIALEIDDSGPSIATEANNLLSSCFGSRFTIRLDTQDIKSDGKTSEIFDITVIDNENGTVSSLSDKSGGEKTWLEDAVTKAIALKNAERSEKRYHTLFTDERDGALSQETKREFFLMKRRALELGGFQTEFFISHSSEARDVADRRLVFKKGVGVVVE